MQKKEAGIRNAVVTRTRQDLLVENKNRRGLDRKEWLELLIVVQETRL